MKSLFDSFPLAVQKYFEMDHDEPVPASDLLKEPTYIYYLPIMHAIWKESRITTKLRVVFDALAKTESGVSLNNRLLVGPNVSVPLVDMLLRFQ